MAKSTITLKDILTDLAGAARRGYEQAKAKFQASVETNPAEALVWHGEAMAKAQARYEVWLRAEADLAAHDAAEVLRETHKDVRRRIESFFGSNSTSLFSNAVERARAEALVAVHRDLESLAREVREKVAEADACPKCGEREMDRLVWQDDGETVRCAACGTRYTPTTK